MTDEILQVEVGCRTRMRTIGGFLQVVIHSTAGAMRRCEVTVPKITFESASPFREMHVRTVTCDESPL